VNPSDARSSAATEPLPEIVVGQDKVQHMKLTHGLSLAAPEGYGDGTPANPKESLP